jgi:maleate cis-trans isomerase
MARRRDFRRIGLLLPSSSSVQERDFCRVLPEDITLHVARMRLSNVEAESTLRIVQEIEIESQKLADVDVDVIVFPATAPSSRNGIGYDQELIKRISAASGKPATTASTALLKALRVLSAKQIALGAPWSALAPTDSFTFSRISLFPRRIGQSASRDKTAQKASFCSGARMGTFSRVCACARAREIIEEIPLELP